MIQVFVDCIGGTHKNRVTLKVDIALIECLYPDGLEVSYCHSTWIGDTYDFISFKTPISCRILGVIEVHPGSISAESVINDLTSTRGGVRLYLNTSSVITNSIAADSSKTTL